MNDYRTLIDSELADRLRLGDRAAFAEIYERYKYPLHAHAINKLRDREEARDIIQEIFVYLWTKREDIQLTNLSGYLYGAVRNAILNKVTHAKVVDKYFASLQSFSINGTIETDHRIREHQLRELINKEIAALPPKMREIFELSRNEHLSHEEIASQLGLSKQTVSKQISNALRILKTKLGTVAFLYLLFHP